MTTTRNNLRKEIDPYCASDTDADKIISIIEKRIDSHIAKTWLVDKKAEILLRQELQDIKKELLK